LKEKAIDLLESNKEEVVRMVANNAFAIKEMKEEERKEGIKEGELKGKIEAIKAILDVFSDEEIAKRLKVDVELVEKIRKDS
ncbi:MAG: hypothetical protein ACRC6T_10840, partial [Sarcina sp.]